MPGKAVSGLLHKQASGLVHGMLAASLAVTPCKSSPEFEGVQGADLQKSL
jgi:hypothetical protein